MARLLLAMAAMSALLLTCVSAGRDSQGTEFILGYMENRVGSGNGNDIELFITTTSNTPATVTVTTPLFNSGWSEQITVSRGNIKMVKVPHAICGKGVEKSNKGVHVIATQEVSVYSVNKETYSTDAYISLPLDVLGTEYYAMTYERDAELLVVGTEDNTQVSIKWPTGAGQCSVTYGGTTYQNGETLTLTLNKFETFHALQANADGDFTGAYITSNNPISVISGNKKIAVPLNAGSADHLTEMLMSVDTWGKTFMSTSTPDRGIGDRYRIVASEPNTVVTFANGQTHSISKAGDFKEIDIATGDYQKITSNKPVMMVMFTKTFQNDGPNKGDPAMSIITPEPQYASDYTWSSVREPSGLDFNNKISAIIEKSKKSGLRLDGSPVTWNEEKDIQGSTKIHLWKRVNPGSHNIYHTDPSITFMAMASGTLDYNSYAYAAGLRLAQINTVCVPSAMTAGDILDNDCDGRIDEEALNNVDDDGDGQIDEDLALPPRVDGIWGNWGSYGSCSVPCGGTGVKTRTRPCDNPAPANNGLYCVGTGSETMSCNNGACAVNGAWGSWGSYGSCSVTCGTGTQSRTRACNNPAPAHGGANCAGINQESRSCTQPVCSTCSGSAKADIVFVMDASGSVGSSNFQKMREFVRDTVNIFDIASDKIRVGVQKYSSGTNTEFNLDESYDKNTIKSKVMNIAYTGGGTNTGGALAYLRNTMFTSANGDRAGVRNIGVILTDGRSNNYQLTATEAKNCRDGGMTVISIGIGSGIPVVELNEMATDPDSDYVFSVSSFSALSGIQASFQQVACTTPPAFNGAFTTWSGWGTCSTTCDVGTTKRTRSCTNPPPANGGTNCVGATEETTGCNLRPCPVDGGWSTWQAWSACSVSCLGIGVRGRVRACDNPIPLHGGAQCPGAGSETMTCDKSLTLCSPGSGWASNVYSTTPGTPVNGGFSPWGPWSLCSKTCGAGRRLRKRECNSPVPQFGGTICYGAFVQKEICGNVPCSATSNYVQPCPERFFDCRDGNKTCVHYLEKCDCKPDCDDGSDEDQDYAGCISSNEVCNNNAHVFAPITMLTLLLVVLATVLPSCFTDLGHRDPRLH